MVTLYYAVAHLLDDRGLSSLSRHEVTHFERLRQEVKRKDDDELGADEMRAIEFAQYSQGTTSGTYLTARLRIFLQLERKSVLDNIA